MALLGFRNPRFVNLSKVGGLTHINAAAFSLLRAIPSGIAILSFLLPSWAKGLFRFLIFMFQKDHEETSDFSGSPLSISGK